MFFFFASSLSFPVMWCSLSSSLLVANGTTGRQISGVRISFLFPHFELTCKQPTINIWLRFKGVLAILNLTGHSAPFFPSQPSYPTPFWESKQALFLFRGDGFFLSLQRNPQRDGEGEMRMRRERKAKRKSAFFHNHLFADHKLSTNNITRLSIISFTQLRWCCLSWGDVSLSLKHIPLSLSCCLAKRKGRGNDSSFFTHRFIHRPHPDLPFTQLLVDA